MATLAVYLVVGVPTIVILLVVWRYALAYSKFRGVRLVTCPETAKPAAVEVDAKHAALRGVFGKLNLQLKGCSRWPERQWNDIRAEALPEVLTAYWPVCWKPGNLVGAAKLVLESAFSKEVGHE